MSALKVSAVIPAYNEAEAIGGVVAEVRQALSSGAPEHEVLVVDDGSTDGTAEAARKAGATVLRHPTNGGYGHALETGIRAARHDWVLMIDADGSYPPSQIARLLEYAPAFDLIIGTRTGVHFWGTPMQAFLRWVYLRIASFISGVPVPDANSGLRLVRAAHLRQGPVECRGFSFSTTMTLSFLQSGRFVKFVPIEFVARVGQSKVRKFRDILRTLQLMVMVMLAYNPLKLFVTLGLVPLAAWIAGASWWLAGGGLSAMVLSCAGALGALLCLIAGSLLYSLRIRERSAPAASS